jgi:hypothetical protein
MKKQQEQLLSLFIKQLLLPGTKCHALGTNAPSSDKETEFSLAEVPGKWPGGRDNSGVTS